MLLVADGAVRGDLARAVYLLIRRACVADLHLDRVALLRVLLVVEQLLRLRVVIGPIGQVLHPQVLGCVVDIGEIKFQVALVDSSYLLGDSAVLHVLVDRAGVLLLEVLEELGGRLLADCPIVIGSAWYFRDLVRRITFDGILLWRLNLSQRLLLGRDKDTVVVIAGSSRRYTADIESLLRRHRLLLLWLLLFLFFLLSFRLFFGESQ